MSKKAEKSRPGIFTRAKRAAQVFLDSDGYEVLDPTPIAPPIGYKKSPSMFDLVRQQIRSEKLAQEAREQGLETFDEADDFDIPDDPVDPNTPFEEMFDPGPPPPRYRTAEEELDPRRPHRQPPPPTRSPDPQDTPPRNAPRSAGGVKGREAPREALDPPEDQ